MGLPALSALPRFSALMAASSPEAAQQQVSGGGGTRAVGRPVFMVVYCTDFVMFVDKL